MTDKELTLKAIAAMNNAYAPYSEFKVGAAILTNDGRVFCGCNIENAAYPAGICAERSAIAGAVSSGAKGFKKIAIVGGKKGKITDYCPPCGICRQVLNEFCSEDFEILLFNGTEVKSHLLKELLPFGFGGEDIC